MKEESKRDVISSGCGIDGEQLQTWSWHGEHQWGLELAETVRSHIRERMSDQKEMGTCMLCRVKEKDG